jgi:uncharacterized integral membrane protein
MSKSESLSRAERRIRAGQTVRVIIWLVVLAAVVVFAAVNTDKVNVDWVFDQTNAPLWLVIGASALAGALFGYVARPSSR